MLVYNSIYNNMHIKFKTNHYTYFVVKSNYPEVKYLHSIKLPRQESYRRLYSKIKILIKIKYHV